VVNDLVLFLFFVGFNWVCFHSIVQISYSTEFMFLWMAWVLWNNMVDQTKSVYRYKNTKTKLLQCCANIQFNKQCLQNNVTPIYARIQIPKTSPAAKLTQRKIQVRRIKDELKYLYHKKDRLNTQLYEAPLQAAAEWGPSWDLISTSIHDMHHVLMNNKHRRMHNKLVGSRGGVVVEALHYKPEGRGFDSRCCHWIISLS
jgi:hypothetical protein